MSKFTPINYLNANEKKLLYETQKRIKKASNKRELLYHELVLEELLRTAFIKHKNTETNSSTTDKYQHA